MLASPDAKLVARERSLPGLALVLDHSALSDALRHEGFSVSLPAANAFYVRYKPGTSCLVGYASPEQREGGLFYATAFTPGSGKLKKAPFRRKARWLPGGGRFVLERHAVELCLFPNDDHLPALIHLRDPDSGTAFIRERVPLDPADGELRTRLLAYRPERRCTFSVSTGDDPRAILKAYSRTAFEQAERVATLSLCFQGVNVQKLLGVDHRKRLLFFEWLRGEPLTELILRGRASASELRATGAALARLHKSSAPLLQISDPISDGLKLLELSQTLRSLTPLWYQAARRAAEHAADIVASDPSARVVIHGDFYSQQVLLDGGDVFIIDFDEMAIGTPGMDLGNFAAHLELEVLLGQLRAVQAERVWGGLSDGYSEIAELPSEQLLAAYTASGLLRLSHDPFRRHIANWPEITGQIIGRVESILAALAPYESSTRSTGDADLRRRINHEVDPAMPWLEDALDPLCAARELSGRLQLNERPLRVSSVQTVRLVRHKRGRRALLEYAVDLDEDRAVPRTYVAKVRARRLDRDTYELLHALRGSGFGDDAADGIRVPSPAGLVKRFNMWLSEKVSGTAATEFLLGAGAHDVMCHVFNAAEKLHNASVLPVREHTMSDELSTLSDRICQLGARRPDLQRRIDDLFRACEQLALGYLEYERTPVHRDYYGDQLLIEGRDVWLLDLDQFSMGDPALDYGNFLAHVTELALRQTGATDAAITANNALLESCHVAHGAEFAERVEVYHTLTLVRHLWISTEKVERRSVTDPLLSLCENRLESAASDSGIHR